MAYFKTDGSEGYHNMREIDVIYANIDIIKKGLTDAGIPLANYRKYISSGKFVYDNPNTEERVQEAEKSQETIVREIRSDANLDRT